MLCRGLVVKIVLKQDDSHMSFMWFPAEDRKERTRVTLMNVTGENLGDNENL